MSATTPPQSPTAAPAKLPPAIVETAQAGEPPQTASDVWLLVSFALYLGVAGLLVYLVVGTGNAKAPERTIGDVQGAPIDGSADAAPTGTVVTYEPILPDEFPARGNRNGRNAGTPGNASPSDNALADMTQFILREPDEVTYTDDGFRVVSFATLAGFQYEPPMPENFDELKFDPNAPPVKGEIPDFVRALDGTKVAVTGFAMPTAMEGTATTNFVLLGTQIGCCFGGFPRINEMIEVRMAEGKLATVFRDWPFTVYGTLHVGEYYEDGVLLGIYRITADRAVDALPQK